MVMYNPSITEPGSCLQLAVARTTEWKYSTSKMYDHGKRRGIKTGDTESSYIWLGIVDIRFGGDGRCWGEMDMVQLDM